MFFTFRAYIPDGFFQDIIDKIEKTNNPIIDISWLFLGNNNENYDNKIIKR